MNKLSIGIILIALASCGGGTSQSTRAAPPPILNGFGTIFDGPNGTITEIPSMPSAGSGPFSASEVSTYDNLGSLNLDGVSLGQPNVSSASYNGFIKLLESNATTGVTENVYIGRATVNADFLNQTVDGTTSDYFRNVGSPGNTVIASQVVGSLPITNGSTTPNSGFIGSLYGQLNDGGRVLDIKSNFDGSFSTSASGSQSLAIATVTGSFGDAPTLTLLNGEIVVAR